MAAPIIYTVLYTHQKMKKAKTWHDGSLRIAVNGQRANLFDSKNSKLDSVYLRTKEITVGEELESDKYLIQVEAIQTHVQDSQVTNTGPAPSLQPARWQPSVSSNIKRPSANIGMRIGLKRKKSGFVPPRQVKAKTDRCAEPEPHELNRVPPLHGAPVPQPASVATSGEMNRLYAQPSQNASPPTAVSPWSIVGKPKPSPTLSPIFTSPHTPAAHADSSFHTEKQNVDFETQGADAGVGKRSTSQILALIADRRSSFKSSVGKQASQSTLLNAVSSHNRITSGLHDKDSSPVQRQTDQVNKCGIQNRIIDQSKGLFGDEIQKLAADSSYEDSQKRSFSPGIPTNHVDTLSRDNPYKFDVPYLPENDFDTKKELSADKYSPSVDIRKAEHDSKIDKLPTSLEVKQNHLDMVTENPINFLGNFPSSQPQSQTGISQESGTEKSSNQDEENNLNNSACFDMNFSPLSNVPESDDDVDITGKETSSLDRATCDNTINPTNIKSGEAEDDTVETCTADAQDNNTEIKEQVRNANSDIICKFNDGNAYVKHSLHKMTVNNSPQVNDVTVKNSLDISQNSNYKPKPTDPSQESHFEVPSDFFDDDFTQEQETLDCSGQLNNNIDVISEDIVEESNSNMLLKLKHSAINNEINSQNHVEECKIESQATALDEKHTPFFDGPKKDLNWSEANMSYTKGKTATLLDLQFSQDSEMFKVESQDEAMNDIFLKKENRSAPLAFMEHVATSKILARRTTKSSLLLDIQQKEQLQEQGTSQPARIQVDEKGFASGSSSRNTFSQDSMTYELHQPRDTQVHLSMGPEHDTVECSGETPISPSSATYLNSEKRCYGVRMRADSPLIKPGSACPVPMPEEDFCENRRIDTEDPLAGVKSQTSANTYHIRQDHYTFPHPSELMGKHAFKVMNSNESQPQNDLSTIVSKSLEGYALKGMKSGGTVVRDVSATAERICPRTPDMGDLKQEPLSSFYKFEPTEKWKSGFISTSDFITSSESYLGKLNHEQTPAPSKYHSPLQQVPKEVSHLNYEQPVKQKMERKPIKTTPFEDEVSKINKGTSERVHTAGDTESLLATPESQKVPVWMQQSPDDTSFSLTPLNFTVTTSHLTRPDTGNFISDGMDSESPGAEFVPKLRNCAKPIEVSKGSDGAYSVPRRSTNLLPAGVSRHIAPDSRVFKLHGYKRSGNMKENNMINQIDDNRGNNMTGIGSDAYDQSQASPKHIRRAVFSDIENKDPVEMNGGEGIMHSKWGKFDVQRECSDATVKAPHPFKTYGNAASFKKGAIKSGVDHLVPVSPVNQAVVQLNSDNSQSQDTQDSCYYGELFESPLAPPTREPLTSYQTSLPGADVNSGTPAIEITHNETPQMAQNIAASRRGFKAPRVITSSASLASGVKSRGFTAPAAGFKKGPKISSSERSVCGELYFASREEVEASVTPTRDLQIPVTFQDATAYRHIFSAALTEYMNIQLFERAKAYHGAVSNIDVSQYSPQSRVGRDQWRKKVAKTSSNPPCEHGRPSKIAQVKKEGPNKGRFFFSCNGAQNERCKFFKWVDTVNKSNQYNETPGRGAQVSLTDGDSVATFVKGQGVALYCECTFLRKVPDSYKPHMKNVPAWVKNKMMLENEYKQKKMFIKLSRKESSTHYSKDDLWVVTQSLSCESAVTFLAKSVFFGPTSQSEVEIEPVCGFSPSNWPSEVMCHAIHAGNYSSEFVCLETLQEHVFPHSLPILPHLLNRGHGDMVPTGDQFKTRSIQQNETFCGHWSLISDDTEELIQKYSLNEHQAEALRGVAGMFHSEPEHRTPPLALIHGVFGAGKSFLLAVMVELLVKLLEMKDLYSAGVAEPSKLLISSTTNVAVDRILQGLLNNGFEQFVRVGSVKKIAKPILPYSVHATGSASQELRDLQEMLKGDLVAAEKVHVRKSIERLKQGVNKKRLQQVRVVGATCAACPFKCMSELRFSVVVLDECSQITEPTSLLPIARFGCEKVVLVGDPKQLDPTIQGSDATHAFGLEQTLFDRLLKMGHEAVMLRTQYRCHPTISAIPNQLFYHNQLIDGVTQADRPALAPGWPTLCFFDVADGRESCEFGNSFVNEAEAGFVVLLIEALILDGVRAEEIGVITLYKAQQARIAALLHASSLGEEAEVACVQVSTVDAFQGGERGVIILSCVRTHSTAFMDNDKRTNVALTRSRNHLFIVGNRTNLLRNTLWTTVLRHCEASREGIQNAQKFRAMLEEKMRNLESEQTENVQKSAKRSKGKKGARVSRSSTPTAVSMDDSEDFEQSSKDTCSITSQDTDRMNTPVTNHGAERSTTAYTQAATEALLGDIDGSGNSPAAAAKRVPRRTLPDPSVFGENDSNSSSDSDFPEVDIYSNIRGDSYVK